MHKPTSGTITFNGQDVTSLRPDQVAKLGIARTFQSTSLFDKATVLDNLIVGHRLRTPRGCGMCCAAPAACAKKSACAAKKRVMRWTLSASRPSPIAWRATSRRKSASAWLALALATDPKLLLLDEPAGGVNPEETEGLAQLIRKFVQHGMTVALIEHKMAMIMSLADKILVLSYGEKIAEGTPDAIRRNPAVIDAYLGSEHAEV
jgi:ABC-type branched-chain amino acid transport systems, ATPase component